MSSKSMAENIHSTLRMIPRMLGLTVSWFGGAWPRYAQAQASLSVHVWVCMHMYVSIQVPDITLSWVWQACMSSSCLLPRRAFFTTARKPFFLGICSGTHRYIGCVPCTPACARRQLGVWISWRLLGLGNGLTGAVMQLLLVA